MHPMLNIGIRAARSAAEIITRSMDRLQGVTVTEKSQNDFVSEVDKQAENSIIETIHKAYPDHAILAEESGASGEHEYQWIIDPLDGTTNFLHGFPQFAISIALKHKSTLEQALIYDPLRQELFTAGRGSGAYLNNRRIRVSRRNTLAGALIGTGFPMRALNKADDYLATFKKLIPLTAGIRRPGAASLDLAYVASGRLDGFWEYGLEQWDIAAGILMIREAGGFVSDITSQNTDLLSGDIVAGTPSVHDLLAGVIRESENRNNSK